MKNLKIGQKVWIIYDAKPLKVMVCKVSSVEQLIFVPTKDLQRVKVNHYWATTNAPKPQPEYKVEPQDCWNTRKGALKNYEHGNR